MLGQNEFGEKDMNEINEMKEEENKSPEEILVQDNIKALKLSQKKYKGVYIAVMPNEDHYDLEVELDAGTIGFTSQSGDLDTARDDADLLQEALNKAGINVYETREEWEEA